MPLRFLAAASLLVVAGPLRAGESVDYVRDIKPLLAEKCYSCHGAWKQKGKLRLETAALMAKGGRGGPAVVPGKPDESLILPYLTGADGYERMPPEGEGEHLTAEQLAKLTAWIRDGAKAPDEPIPPDPRQHWAFHSPTRPPVPAVKNAKWVRTPIDAFLAAAHEKNGLVPEPEADRRTLLRRVTLDLTGLPPTPEEIHAFLKDTSPAAYETVVDRLLASPRYGERWGRHWLDVWRYSDWSGENNNQVRGSPKHVWRWRDWVIESLNADAGYDRMVREMLAGDEIAPNDPATLRATGFLARNFYKFNRNVWLDDAVEHTAKAFLGLTVACCRCHDHKFDPVTQVEYFRLRAVFEPHNVRTDPVNGEKNLDKDGLVRVFDKDPQTPTYVFARGEESKPLKDEPLSPGVPDVLGGTFEVRPPSAASTGRRLALARWITDAKNPLAARVAVNHVWLRHFGKPLVEGVVDFGLRTDRPRHAALLDWLAVEFVESGWSMKKLHRLMVTSAAYRMKSDSASVRPENRRRDPDNRDHWRMNAQRLEGEAVRDGLLFAAGSLDLKMGGPEIALTEGETSPRRAVYMRHAHERQAKMLEVFDAASPLECYRRAVTVIPHQALALLNGPLATDQSRVLAGRLKGETDADFLAAAFERVLGRLPTAEEATMCRHYLDEQTKRLAAPATLTPTTDGPAAKVPPAADAKQRARENLVHVLFNHNDFVTVR